MSEDTEAELSRFRQQWQEEVTSRARAPKVPPASTGTPSTSRLKPLAPSFASARSRAPTDRPSVDEDLEDEFIEEPRGAETARSPRTSVSVGRRSSAAGLEAPLSALEHYEAAVEKETQGSLGESLKLYRQAYRLDDRVDKEYKDKYFPRPPQLTGKGKKPGTAVPDPPVPLAGLSTAHHSLPNRPLGVSGLIASFAGLRIQPPAAASLTNAPGEDEPLETDQPLEDVFSPLSTIPSELVLHILRDLALTDFASFARTAQACKSLCYMVCTEQGIYRDVCARVYARQVWDWVVTVSGSPLYRLDTEPAATLYQPDAEQYADENAPDPDSDEALARLLPSDESELAHYDNSWRTMLRLRPRIRYNGVYISTCNYQRPGGASATAVTWNSPVHIITYYRYLRFFPDGTVLSLLTTHEPADVVYSFSKSSTDSASWAKYLSRGRWRLDRDGRVEVETIPPAGMERYLFRMQLRVARVGRAGAKKLLWEGFWSWNRLTEDLAEFTGRNDRPFFFSRVGTVDREMATVGV